MRELREIRVRFTPEGIEISTTYTHPDDLEVANPGTKTRTSTAAKMAAHGLRLALEGLETDPLIWGGFATNTRTSKDTVVIDRGDHAA